MIEGLRKLANMRDDRGLPSMSLDSMRREVTALMARASNDNATNQETT